jgi:hypothetical protein
MPAAVELVNAALSVGPGSTVSATIRLRNTGRIVDEFSLVPVGEFAPWMTVEPASLPLFPDASGEVRVTFQPPRASTPAAGSYPFAVRVRSREDAAFSYVAEGRIQVQPLLAVTARMTPRTSSGGRLSHAGKHRIEIDNAGNLPATVDVTGGDPDERLTVQPDQARVVVPAGGSALVRVQVKARKGMLQGSPLTIPFQVVVSPAGAAPVMLDGSLSQRAVLPSGLGQVLIAIVPLLVVAFIAKTVIDNVTKANASPSPSAIALATPSPTPTPSPSPSPTLAPSATPAPSPSPTPVIPLADATLRGLGLFDPAGQGNPAATFGFHVDGGGTISAKALIASGPLKICIGQQGHTPTCGSGATGLLVKKATTVAGTWTVSLTGASNGNSSTVDFELTYPAASPSLEISGIPFAGSMAKTGLDLTVVATASGPLTLNASWGVVRPDPNVVLSPFSSYDLRFLNVAQPGTPITSSGESTTNATAPSTFMLPPNAYDLTLTSRNATNDLVLDGTVSWP